MGKSCSDLKKLICMQVLLKLFMPVLMSFMMLWTAAPFVNHKLNSILPIHDHLLKAMGSFMVCFFVLYLCYFGMVYVISTPIYQIYHETVKNRASIGIGIPPGNRAVRAHRKRAPRR